MSYYYLIGRSTGLFSGGCHRVFALNTLPSSTIRAFASSTTIASSNTNTKNNTKTQLGLFYPRNNAVLSPNLTTPNNTILKQLYRQMSSTGDHVTLWTLEKAISTALLGIIPLAFLVPCAAMDYLLAFSIVVHSHWGIEAIVLDYIRPSIFGETLPKVGVAMVYGLSALTLGGLIYFTYTDVGLVNAIKMLWKL